MSDHIHHEPSPEGEGKIVIDKVVSDLVERAKFGKEKYGTFLKTNNGRRALVDAYQEALDLVMYLKQRLMEDEEKYIESQKQSTCKSPSILGCIDSQNEAGLARLLFDLASLDNGGRDMRKPEDVVLDDEKVRRAVKAYLGCCRDAYGSMAAALRTYIAELDLIPRPQKIGEWVEQMPASVWERAPRDTNCVALWWYNYNTGLIGEISGFPRIPRPKPPRMTDEEIDKAAIDAAIRTHPCNERELTRSEEIAFYAGVALAERAKLEKERGNE